MVDLLHRPEDAAPVLRRWADLLHDLPRQATLTASAFTVDPGSDLPAELRGRPIVSIGYVWVGDVEAGRRLLPAFQALGTPVTEMVREIAYVELQRLFDSAQMHNVRRYWKDHFLRELTDEAIAAYLARGADVDAADPARLPGADLQSYGGAIADIDHDDSAFSQRDARFEFITSTRWTNPEEDEARLAGARRYAKAIEPFASGAYVNALADEGQAGVERAYGSAKLARLTTLKQRYDPDNVFHLNHNIRP
jgi:hypothetical protein